MNDFMDAMKLDVSRYCNDDEFVGDDLLIHCKTCGEPKQELIRDASEYHCSPNLLHTKAQPRLCKCERTRGDEQRIASMLMEKEEAIRESRRDCFGNNSYISAVFDESETSKAAQSCRAYAEHFNDKMKNGQTPRTGGVGLLLYGPIGTGKTYLAASIANLLVDKGYKVKFTSLPAICDQITGNFGNTEKILDELSSYDLVVLDELRKEETESSNPKTSDRVYRVIDRLYSNKIPMIITTNLPKETIKNRDGAAYRIYSRILGRCVLIPVNGTDRRIDDSNDNKENLKEMILNEH